MVLDHMENLGHETVVFGHDVATGLRAVIAVHSTLLGPALGGTRFQPYACEGDALVDALRLSHGMTAKASLAGLDLGGGKGVILGDPRRDKTPELLAAYGRMITGLGGRFITAEDMGIGPADVDQIAHEAGGWTVGGSESTGGSGDPSPWTAMGVELSIREVLSRLTGSDDLAGRSVAIAGVGKVGSALAARLVVAGCRVVVADIDAGAIARFSAHVTVEVVEPEIVHTCDVDVFAPCAAGRVLDERRIGELRCSAVVGSANDQLATPEDAARLASKEILCAPDFVVNAGGLISVADELDGWDEERVCRRVEGIPATLAAVLDHAETMRITPIDAARQLADARLEQAEAARNRKLPDRRPQDPVRPASAGTC